MKIKIYASDEGYGHISRLYAIIYELLKYKNIEITLQNRYCLDYAQEILDNKVKYIDRFNNIMTLKHKGKLNRKRTYELIKNYCRDSEKFIEIEKKEFDYDAIISDFVPEAFYVGKEFKIPSYGVAHFTWDWFVEKTFIGKKRTKDIIKKMETYAKHADKIYFPPLTPNKILKKYEDIAINVPFVVRNTIIKNKNNKIPKVIVMTGGTNSLSEYIERNAPQMRECKEFQFFLEPKFSLDYNNSNINIMNFKDVPQHIADADLVVTRPGFNTISECIAGNTPMLLIGENHNPEIKKNIKYITDLGIAKKLKFMDFKKKFIKKLKKFYKKDYDDVLNNYKKLKFEINGAEVVANAILKRN